MSFYGLSKAEKMYETDTVIVEFGNNSKLIIYVNSDEDLAALEEYDINAMIAELNMNIASTQDANYLQITDESGTRFLKDTTIQVQNDGVKYYNDRDEVEDSYADNNSSRISIGNIDLDIDNDVFDDDDFDIDLDNKKWTERKHSKRSFDRRRNRTRHYFEIDLGLNNWLEDGGFPDENNQLYAVKPFGSWYVALRSIQKTSVGGPLFINWGGGISWYNWKFENANVNIQKGTDGIVFFENPDPTINGIKSKLAASYINIEFMPMLDFSYGKRKVKELDAGSVRITRYKKRGIRIGIGGYAGYRLASWSKFVFKENGDKDKDKEKSNFFLNNVRYGIRAQIGFKGMDFFANYDLNEVFSAGSSPKLNAISFGITL